MALYSANTARVSGHPTIYSARATNSTWLNDRGNARGLGVDEEAPAGGGEEASGSEQGLVG